MCEENRFEEEKSISKQRKDDEQCLMMLNGSAYFSLNLSLNIPDKVLSETREWVKEGEGGGVKRARGSEREAIGVS